MRNMVKLSKENFNEQPSSEGRASVVADQIPGPADRRKLTVQDQWWVGAHHQWAVN